MDIDIYQACPCHSGTKIKFCCGKEVVADLNQVLTLTKSKQTTAALEHTVRTISKMGPRDCLLALQTHLLIGQRQYDQASEVNEAFVAAHPDNPIGYQHRALLMASSSRSEDAILALQDAIDVAPSDEIPLSLASAFRVVGMLLLMQGDVVSARAHLIFSSRLREDRDETVSRLILQTYRSAQVPLLLKHDFAVNPLPADAPHASLFNNARRYAMRGRWRSALERIEHILASHPDSVPALRAQAVWSAYLGRTDDARMAWHRLSQVSSLPFDEQVEALSMSLLMSDEPITERLDAISTTFPIQDIDAVIEQATASSRLVSGTFSNDQYLEDDVPPPRAVFLQLDRDESKRSEDVNDDQFPRIVAEVFVFGAQTDRQARLEMISVEDEHFERTKNELQQLLPDLLSEPASEEVIGHVSLLDHRMSARWHLPPELSSQEQQQFASKNRAHELLDLWPTIPFNPLDGKTPLEAAGQEEHRKMVAALISMMEQSADAHLNADFDFSRLRDKLGIPNPSRLDAQDCDAIYLSPLQQQRLDYTSLPDKELIQIYVTGSTIGNFRLLRQCSDEILSRPSLEEYVHFENVYSTLARITHDAEQALQHLQKARQHAKSAARPQGDLLVQELEIRLARGLTDKIPELLRTIQTSYANDGDVQYHLASVLHRFGLIDAEGRLRFDPESLAPSTAQSPTAAESDLWTPESAAQPAGADSGGQEGKSKLWLPD